MATDSQPYQGRLVDPERKADFTVQKILREFGRTDKTDKTLNNIK
jgi:hypothetical protein